MPEQLDFLEEPEQLDFVADEDALKAAVQVPQAITSTLTRTMEAGATGSEMAREQTRPARSILAAMESAGLPPGATEGQEAFAGGVPITQPLTAGPGFAAQVAATPLREALKTGEQTYQRAHRIPPPFVISTRGPQDELRQLTPTEERERIAPESQPLIQFPRTQIQPEGPEGLRMIEGLTSPENLTLLAAGEAGPMAGIAILGTMIPGLVDDVKRVVSGNESQDQKRETLANLLVPAVLMLRGRLPKVGEITPNLRAVTPPPEAPPLTMETAEQMQPLPMTGRNIPGTPRGAFPPMPAVAGREVLGPPAPVRPEVPATPPEAERGMSVIEEIRRRNLRTNKQIREAFPDYAGEVADLRRQAWGGAPDTGVRVAPTIPRPTPMPELGITPPPQGPPAPTVQEAGAMESMRQARELEDQRARQQSAIAQQIITWERELEFAQNRGDQRAVDQASQKLLDLRKQYEGPPAPSRQIVPKPPIPRAPGARFRPEVPGTPAEPREDVISEIRRRNLRTREQILTAFPEMRQQEGAREKAAALRDQAWGKQPPGEPPAAPPAAPPPEPPPTQPPGPPPAGPAPSITPPPPAGEGAPVTPPEASPAVQAQLREARQKSIRRLQQEGGLTEERANQLLDAKDPKKLLRQWAEEQGVFISEADLQAGADLVKSLQPPDITPAGLAILGSLKPTGAPAGTPTLPEGARARLQGRVKRAREEGVLTPPEVASMGPAGAGGKDPFGNPLGTKYHATPEDWAKWQELQTQFETAKKDKDFTAMPQIGAQMEALRNRYGGQTPFPPKTPTAPKAAAATLTPDDLQPALLVNGKPVTGGKDHDEIHKNASATAGTDEEHAALFEALADDSKHVFVDKAGNVYTRDQAAKALGEKDPLQSARLRELQQKAAPAPEAPPAVPEAPAAPAGIEGTVIAGKTLAEWEAVKDASDLPKPSKDDPDNKRRAILAKWLAVPNQPSRILQALANKKRTREIHAPPPAAVAPVAPEAPEVAAAPSGKAPAMMTEDEYETWLQKNYPGQAFVPASEPNTGGGSLHGLAAEAYRAIQKGEPVGPEARQALEDAVQGNEEHRANMLKFEKENDARRNIDQTAVDVSKEQADKIDAAYSADKLPKTRAPFTWEGKLRITLGSEFGLERDLHRTFELVPEDQWKGPTYTQQELYARWDEGKGERGDDTGLKVTHKGKPYVLANQKIFRFRKAEGVPTTPAAPPAAEPPAEAEPHPIDALLPQVGAKGKGKPSEDGKTYRTPPITKGQYEDLWKMVEDEGLDWTVTGFDKQGSKWIGEFQKKATPLEKEINERQRIIGNIKAAIDMDPSQTEAGNARIAQLQKEIDDLKAGKAPEAAPATVPETKAPVPETKAAVPETKPAPAETKVVQAVKAATLPTEEDVKQFLSVPEPDVTEQKEAAKFAVRQMTELQKQKDEKVKEWEKIHKDITVTRGYRKGRISTSAPAAKKLRYGELGKDISNLTGQIEAIRRAAAKDTLAAELAGEARRVNDTNSSLLDRLGARTRMFAAAGERVPDELATALRVLAEEEVRKRYPDATKQELQELGVEVQRSAMLHYPLDKEFELNPIFRGLYPRRIGILENVAFGQQAPYNEFSKELRDRIAKYTTRNRPSEWYGKPVESQISIAELESIKAQIAEETDRVQRNAAELEAKRQAEEAAEKAKEAQLMAEAQKVADSLPHVGRKGAPSADSVRLELTRRVKGAIDETIAKSGVKLTRSEAGDYYASTGDGTITATGDIEENKLKSGKSNYRVTAYRMGKQDRKVSATVPTLEEAEWVIKAAAAEAPGRAIIGVPGDGVYTLNRTGMGLLETWAQARNLDTAANIKLGVGLSAKAREGRGGGAEKPPGIPKTVGDWNETKEYYGLRDTDKIAEYSPELQRLAQSAESKTGKAAADITTADIDDWLKRKAQGEQSKGPGAAAEAEFAERPPDPEVLGLSAGNPVYNRIERGFRNLFSGLSQLGKRKATKQDFMQWINAADNMPRQAGLEAGNSLRERATVQQQNAVTALMQAFKMSGMGLEPARVAEMEFGGNPTGWLRTTVADMETAAQGFLNKGLKLEAQAAIDERNAARYALDHFNELRPLAELAKRKFDLQHARLANAGVDVNYENWYVPQRHELDLFSGQDRPIVLGHSRGAGAATGFKKAKTYPNYAEAIENGFVPRSLAIGDLLEHYVATTEKVLTYKGLFNSLGEVMDPVDNNPLATKIPRRVIERPDGTTDIQEHVPLGYVAMEVGPGMRLAIHRGYERLIRALTSSSQLSESAVVGTLQDLAAIEKHMMLALDTFHASRTLQAELALTHAASLPGTERLARGLALVELSPQDLDQAVRNGRITQEIADWIRTPSPVEVGGRQVSLSPRNIFRLGLQSGLNITRFADVMYRDWLREVPVLGTVNRWVFDKMTRSAMSQAFIAEFVRNAKANPGMNAKRVALKTASDINVMFGNLQKESIFRNPSMRAINNIVFLAPQWVESLARREGRFAGQIGETIVRAARGEGVALGTVGRGIGTGLAFYFLATQLTNLMTRGHLTFQNKEEGHKLDAWLPIGPHGMFVSPLSVFGEVTHDILRFAETKPDYFQVATQIASNKLGNLGRFLEVVATGRDPLSGEKVVGTARRAIKAATQLVPIPITASGAIRAAASMTGLVQPPAPGALPRQIMGSLGVKTEPAPSPGQQIRQKAQRWALSHGGKIQADAERRLKEDFGPSDYSNLRASLNRNDLEGARRAYQELRQAGKTPTTIRQTMEHPHPFTGSAANEAQFQRALTPEEKELYRAAVAERRELARRFHHMLQQTK